MLVGVSIKTVLVYPLSLSSLSCSAPLIRNEEYRGTIRYPIENGCRYRETLNLPVCANSSQT